jgi:hypothetical protein
MNGINRTDKTEIWLELVKHLVSKGRITAWMIFFAICLLGMTAKIDGNAATELLKWLGGLIIVGEAAARKE